MAPGQPEREEICFLKFSRSAATQREDGRQQIPPASAALGVGMTRLSRPENPGADGSPLKSDVPGQHALFCMPFGPSRNICRPRVFSRCLYSAGSVVGTCDEARPRSVLFDLGPLIDACAIRRTASVCSDIAERSCFKTA